MSTEDISSNVTEASCDAVNSGQSPNVGEASSTQATFPRISEISFWVPQPINTDDAVTQLLENNLHHLEELRATLERKDCKDIIDVREFGDTYAGTLLRGIEGAVDYMDLLAIIKTMKDGIAHRRVALAA